MMMMKPVWRPVLNEANGDGGGGAAAGGGSGGGGGGGCSGCGCCGCGVTLPFPREKLLAMKRYSGFLKRPEILETVYRLL